MKNPSLERLRIQARQYHRHHTWGLEEGGIHARHAYQPERALSWWGDYGFVLNGRRVIGNKRVRVNSFAKKLTLKII